MITVSAVKLMNLDSGLETSLIKLTQGRYVVKIESSLFLSINLKGCEADGALLRLCYENGVINDYVLKEFNSFITFALNFISL